MNAKQELLKLLKNKEIICAEIFFSTEGIDLNNSKKFILKTNYTINDYKTFLSKLDFNYDNGFGIQQLFGTIWFKNNIWAERREHNGSEWWEILFLPNIPNKLQITAEGLLKKLGIITCTKRHLRIVNEFIENKETDCEKLLTQLGEWNTNDLVICKNWIKENY